MEKEMIKITEEKEFMDVLNSIIDEKIKKIAQELIENNPDDYLIEEVDYGHYNNGVGMASYGGEKVYDEDRAYDDAREFLAIDTVDGCGADYELLFNEEFLTAIGKYIRSR